MGKSIPKAIQIEPIFGCNASCVMCVIDMPTNRKKGIMKMDLFKKIIDDLSPYADRIEQVDLFGLGEPLLDKHIYERVKYLKSNGLRGIGISTNGDLLDEEKQDSLLESGIDTVIFSIESTKKEVHEKIRRNTDFDRVVANANQMIHKRDKKNLKTKFVFRFISQELNRGDWEAFKEYWTSRINDDFGDEVNSFNAHDWVGEAEISVKRIKNDLLESAKCYQIFERMFIFSNGTMPMCSCDIHHPFVPIGDVTRANTLDVFNNRKMREIREIHLAGKRNTIDICRKCNLLYSRDKKEVVHSS